MYKKNKKLYTHTPARPTNCRPTRPGVGWGESFFDLLVHVCICSGQISPGPPGPAEITGVKIEINKKINHF